MAESQTTSSRLIRGTWLVAVLALLAVATVGMALGYQWPHLVGTPEFIALLRDLNIPVWVAITVGLVLPIVSAAALCVAVWRGGREDKMALLFALGLLGAFVFTARASFAVASVYPATRPAMMLMDIVALVPFVFMMFLFPNGVFTPSWSRWLAYALVVPIVAVPGLGQSTGAALSGVSPRSGESAVLVPLMITLVVAAAVAQVIRYRVFSTPLERKQTRWVFFTLGILLMLAVVAVTLLIMVEPTPVWVGWVLLGAAIVEIFVPITVAVALFRYHLYDIDRIINRTVVYGVVVLSLGVIYAVGVFLLQNLVPGEGGLAVAASTLAVAALFNPLRRRVQDLVDRKFYRSRYDAQRLVEEFSTRLSHQLDQTQLTAEWLDAVERALQPAAASVWIRPTGPGKTG